MTPFRRAKTLAGPWSPFSVFPRAGPGVAAAISSQKKPAEDPDAAFSSPKIRRPTLGADC